MSHRRACTRAIMLTTVLGFAACASSGRGGSPFSQDLAERGEIEIKVVNMNFNDATVWAVVSEGMRQRLGNVTGKREEVFTLPWTFSERLRIEFDLVAGPRCYSESLVVNPGDLLELQIASNVSTDPSCR